MHEVGHSLGLRHNFKASTMLTADQLNDTAITRAKGLVGSVMDYSPINIAPKGKKQGDYYSTTIGPYDYWAIEYAYKPIDGDEAAELKKIAARAPEHDLVYATDEDAFLNDDPYVNRWDLGADPCQFGRDRIALATELLKDLDARVVKDGDSWARTRRAFGILLEQWGDGATLASQFIGGQSVSRDHKADKDARDPIVPGRRGQAARVPEVPGRQHPQRQGVPVLAEPCSAGWAPSAGCTGAPTSFVRPGHRHLGARADPGHPEDRPGPLPECRRPWPGSRTSSFRPNPGADPLRMDEVFRSLTDGIWSDLDKLPDPKDAKGAKIALSTIRRNLQREYLRRL